MTPPSPTRRSSDVIALQFLAAREAERRDLRDAHRIILEQPAQPAEQPAIVADRATEHRAEHAEDRIARRCRLALLAVLRGDMADFVPEHAGRSEERRVGKEGVSTCRTRWSPYY